jgi:CubicO group peptidase (beta-lactamase class C family)
MRIRVFLISVVLLQTALPGILSAQDILQRFDEYLFAQHEVNHFIGSVLVAQKGKVLYRMSYGPADFENDVPNDPRMKYRIGSLTKQFTAAAVMMLQEKGLLSIRDPVSRHLPEAPATWKDITIHHLLRHESGIPSFTNFPDYYDFWTLPSRPDKTWLRFRDKPLDFEPGTDIAYSNSGYILLALIIEKVSGMKYEDYLRQRVFDPIGMKDSGHDNPALILKNRAAGYVWGENGLENAAYCDMELTIGGGNLYSTVDDLYKWDRVLRENNLLSDESREAMFTPNKAGAGYGMGISPMFGRVCHSHSGGINGFASQFIRFPEQEVFFIILSNMENAPVFQMGRDLMAIFFGEDYELPVADKQDG